MKLRDVTFENSVFEECYFDDVTSSETFFKNCLIIKTTFYDTGNEEEHVCVHVCMFEAAILTPN